MERIKVQTVYQRADVNQRWSLIILSGSCSKSISFQFFTLNNESVWIDDKILDWFHSIVLDFISKKLETNSKPLKSVK